MMDLGILVLRVGLGVMFSAHGLQKAFGMFAGPGIRGVAHFLGTMGFTPAPFWAYLLAYTELIGGVCVLLGVVPRIASCFLFIVIAVAIFKVHIAKGFFLQNGGFEYPFLIAAVCLALIFLGGGKYSVWNKF